MSTPTMRRSSSTVFHLAKDNSQRRASLVPLKVESRDDNRRPSLISIILAARESSRRSSLAPPNVDPRMSSRRGSRMSSTPFASVGSRRPSSTPSHQRYAGKAGRRRSSTVDAGDFRLIRMYSIIEGSVSDILKGFTSWPMERARVYLTAVTSDTGDLGPLLRQCSGD